MHIENHRWLAGLIAAHTHRTIVGRTRLQKTVRLLQRIGFPTQYRFTIFFYGPYSEELHTELRLLESLELVSETEHRTADGATCYTITATPQAELPEISRFQPLVDRLGQTDLTILELAATYDAFRELGCNHDESLLRLRRKKGTKCDGGRDARALDLLGELGLVKG